MKFKVTARDADGIRREFTREASSRDELSVTLRAGGMLTLSIEEIKENSGALPPPWHPSWLVPVTGFDVETGLRQLGSMLRSGVTLLKGLETLAEQAGAPRVKRVWKKLAEAVFGGRSFADALAENPRHFSEIVVRMSEVGERTGEMEKTITRAADHIEARRNLRSQVINALMYPSLAVAMAVGVSVYLVVAVIPKVAEFLQSGGVELPGMTQMLVDTTQWLRMNWMSAAVVIAASAAAWLTIRLNESGREAEDVLLLHTPIAGRILRLSGTALFSRSMQIMTESGVTLLTALETSAGMMGNRRFRRRVKNAHDSVMGGETLSASLLPAVEFMPMLRRMAAVGEVSGSLPESFGETARFHEMLLSLAIKRFGMLIEPVLIVITGGIVGFVYISFFLALFSMAGMG